MQRQLVSQLRRAGDDDQVVVADRMRARHTAAAKDCRVWIRPDRDGMTRITGLIPPLAATAVGARLADGYPHLGIAA